MIKNKLTLGLLTIFTFLLSGCMGVNTYPDADHYLVGSQTYTETIQTLNTARTTLNFTSGNLDLAHVIVDQLDVDMTSGTLTMGMDTVESANMSMTSGNIYLTLPSEGAKVTITKVAGTINATRAHTQTGNLYTFGSGEADIKISITSGSIYLD